jgi:HlyD family secretion protein
MAATHLQLREQSLKDGHSGAAMDRRLPKAPRWRRPSFILLGALALVIPTLMFLHRPQYLEVVDSPRLSPVVEGDFRDEVVLRARMEPLRSVQLDAVEAGRVEAVFAHEGDWVTAGAPLYRVQSPEQEQLLMQRSAEVAQQLANVSVQRSAQAASHAQNRRELAQLQAAQERAESEYRRVARLASEGFMAAAAVEEALRQQQLASRLLQQAREDQRIEDNIQRRSLEEMARAVESLQSGLKMLEQVRDRLQQSAPISGQLSGFQLQVGTSVRPGDHLGRIDDSTSGMQLVADVDEFYLSRLRTGQKAVTDGSGTLDLVQTLPQVSDGKVRVVLRWPDRAAPPAGLRPGQSLEARLQLSAPVRALLLPDGPGVQTSLYVRQGNELLRRTVRLGRRAAGQVEVLAGLRAGEEVLISLPPTDARRLALP